MNKRSFDEENVCSFFLTRKKRPCRMKPVEGKSFCPHHSHLGNEKDEKKGARIPCPYDSSHFCYESKLQKHLKKCNAREKEKPEYYVQNINAPDVSSSENKKVCLSEVPDDELLHLIEKIKSLYKECTFNICEATDIHPLLKTEMEKVDDGVNSFKHMKQQGSLLAIMDNFGLLNNGTCFIEFGAGKGQLMYWIVKSIPETQKPAFILVDRSAQRHKSDNKFKGSDVQMQRIRMDIQHLHIGKIKEIASKLKHVVGVSKHLCGAATDLALKCLMQTLEYEENGNQMKHKALGLLMALCCHHRCSWNSYVGRKFMERNGITETDFKCMCCIASWAVCGQRKVNNSKSDDHFNINHQDSVQDEKLLNRYMKLNLKHEEREEIGIQCKRLIDAGRINFLESQDYNVKLVNYIDRGTSLENMALLALYENK